MWGYLEREFSQVKIKPAMRASLFRESEKRSMNMVFLKFSLTAQACRQLRPSPTKSIFKVLIRDSFKNGPLLFHLSCKPILVIHVRVFAYMHGVHFVWSLAPVWCLNSKKESEADFIQMNPILSHVGGAPKRLLNVLVGNSTPPSITMSYFISVGTTG